MEKKRLSSTTKIHTQSQRLIKRETESQRLEASPAASRGKKLDFSATQGNIFDETIQTAVKSKYETLSNTNVYAEKTPYGNLAEIASIEEEETPPRSAARVYVNLPQTSEEYWKDVKHRPYAYLNEQGQ